jgi:hypothetical protein
MAGEARRSRQPVRRVGFLTVPPPGGPVLSFRPAFSPAPGPVQPPRAPSGPSMRHCSPRDSRPSTAQRPLWARSRGITPAKAAGPRPEAAAPPERLDNARARPTPDTPPQAPSFFCPKISPPEAPPRAPRDPLASAAPDPLPSAIRLRQRQSADHTRHPAARPQLFLSKNIPAGGFPAHPKRPAPQRRALFGLLLCKNTSRRRHPTAPRNALPSQRRAPFGLLLCKNTSRRRHPTAPRNAFPRQRRA